MKFKIWTKFNNIKEPRRFLLFIIGFIVIITIPMTLLSKYVGPGWDMLHLVIVGGGITLTKIIHDNS